MKDNFIHVCFIVDESGSMSLSKSDVIGGFENTINEQKELKDGKCAVSLFTFNSDVKQIYLGKDVNEITTIDYHPHGMTAMNDGIGTAIDSVGKWLSNMDESERPSKNLIVIMTDGAENHSKEYTFTKVREMIKHQEDKYSWSFIYMGTDLSNMDDVNNLGIKMSSFSTRGDFHKNYSVVNEATKIFRCAKSTSEAYATMDSWLECETSKMSNEYETKTGIKLKQ